MKKMMILAMMMTIAIAANAAMPPRSAMSYENARREALFLSDKMAYELGLTDAQYDAVYEINLDYLMSVTGRDDLYGSWWARRNADLRYVLTALQYDRYLTLGYFYRPLAWDAGVWRLHIYRHYTDRGRLFRARPSVYVSYRGGHNRLAAHFYADRRPLVHGTTWRDTGRGHMAPPPAHGRGHVAPPPAAPGRGHAAPGPGRGRAHNTHHGRR